jgi:hypothetical protein
MFADVDEETEAHRISGKDSKAIFLLLFLKLFISIFMYILFIYLYRFLTFQLHFGNCLLWQCCNYFLAIFCKNIVAFIENKSY